MAQATARKPTAHPYITRKKGVRNGKPIIRDTGIKVSDIVIEYERTGMTPDEIIQAHPHLTLPQVHDALSYYYENIEEIDQEIAEDRQVVEEAKKGFVSILEKKRGEDPNLHR